MQFGVLVHEVLFDFVALLIDEDAWPPEPGRDLPRMAAIVEAKSVEERRRIPPPGEEAYRRQRVELDQTAEIFVNEQARRTKPGRPVYLEATIGYSSDRRATDIDTPKPVEIALPGGGAIRTGARIDRIDRNGHAYVIYDYKSGGYTKIYDPAVPIQKARVVQHVLYMAVAKAALRAKVDPAAVVDEFRFLFPGVRTHGREITFASDLVKEGLEVIEKLCRLPADGVFPATDDVADCKFCDYRDACQAVAGNLEDLCRASGRKIDNPDNTLLAPFVELRRG